MQMPSKVNHLDEVLKLLLFIGPIETAVRKNYIELDCAGNLEIIPGGMVALGDCETKLHEEFV